VELFEEIRRGYTEGDPEQRRQYAVALAEELAEFERPMPVMDEYDLLLGDTPGGIQ